MMMDMFESHRVKVLSSIEAACIYWFIMHMGCHLLAACAADHTFISTHNDIAEEGRVEINNDERWAMRVANAI